MNLATWLGTYKAMTAGVAAADNSTIFLDIDNDPQPDLCLYVLPERGGRIRQDADGYIAGSPELMVEIAASSVSFDLGAKLDVYRRNGVREYIVHRVYDAEIDWFALRDGTYQRLVPDSQGIYRSETFPGLWLRADALLKGDLAAVLAGVQQGCATAEHAAFMKHLASFTPPQA